MKQQKKKNSRTSVGKKAHKKGHFAETLALFFLRFKGYCLLEKNFKTKAGTGLSEIDLIIRRGRTLVFVEVKERKDVGTLPFAVTGVMKERITRTASFYLARHPEYAQFDLRFDVILVRFPFFIRHIQSAWYADWF